MVKTYADMIRTLKLCLGNVYVPVFYVTGTMEWLAIDKREYLRCIEMISNPEDQPFPCYVEQEPDGEIFIHPKVENHA